MKKFEIVVLGKTAVKSPFVKGKFCYKYEIELFGESFDYHGSVHDYEQENKPKYVGFKRVTNTYKIDTNNVLYALLSDAQLGNYSFYEFCDNLGESHDSIKALNSYLECQKTLQKLTKHVSFAEIEAKLNELQENL